MMKTFLLSLLFAVSAFAETQYGDFKIKNGDLIIDGATANRIPYFDSSKKLKWTSITDTQLGDSILPSQTGQSGKFLQTNGSVTSWADASGGGGSGDVVGPDSSVLGNLAIYGDTSGKLLAASGLVWDNDNGFIDVNSVAWLSWSNRCIYDDAGTCGVQSTSTARNLNASDGSTVVDFTDPALLKFKIAAHMPNNIALKWRNKDDNGDIDAIFIDQFNRLTFNGGSGTYIVWNNSYLPGMPLTYDIGIDSDEFRAIYVGAVNIPGTITAGGTTGDRTINKSSGTVNFAAAATAVTVTDSVVSSASIILTNVRTNDSTCTVKNAVPGSGTFTINMTAACTGETSVGFVVINQ